MPFDEESVNIIDDTCDSLGVNGEMATVPSDEHAIWFWESDGKPLIFSFARLADIHETEGLGCHAS